MENASCREIEREREREALFIVVRVLYGLKSACAAFRASMAKKLDDIWLRPDVNLMAMSTMSTY